MPVITIPRYCGITRIKIEWVLAQLKATDLYIAYVYM